MASSSARLVCEIQRKLQSGEPVDGSGQVARDDVAELEARVRCLRAMGDRFAGVRLSRYVTRGCVTGVPHLVGGECVATEV